jgi:hypothetical protein
MVRIDFGAQIQQLRAFAKGMSANPRAARI